MSPIHHHFELAGWPEFTVIVRFWIIAGLCVGGRARPVLRRLHRAREGSGERARSTAERAVVVGAGVAGRRGRRACSSPREPTVARDRGAAARASSATVGDAARRSASRSLPAATNRAHLDGATLVVTSPGVPSARRCSRGRASAGSRSGARWSSARGCADVPYLAVTGTNGKTTTTGMIAACLRAGGLDAVACGNIGHPFPTAAREGHDVLVVECSSFQLRLQASFHPRVSVLLNLAPDHLDWHGSFEAYVAAKATIFARQGAGDVARRQPRRPAAARRVSAEAPCDGRVVPRRARPGAGEVGLDDGELVVASASERERLGPVDGTRAGYRADAAAAAAASLAFGVSAEAVRDGLAASRRRRHRGEIVAEVDGVRFLDNSKATNVHAALAAIDGVEDAVLIAGGRREGRGPARRSRTRAGRLAGGRRDRRGAPPSSCASSRASCPIDDAASIEDAVGDAAFELAPPAGVGPARAGLRELGPVPRLRRARRPVRGGGPGARGGGARWLSGSEPRAPRARATSASRAAQRRDEARPPRGRARAAGLESSDPRRDREAMRPRAASSRCCSSRPRLLTVLGLVMVLSAGSISAVAGLRRQQLLVLPAAGRLRGRRASSRWWWPRGCRTPSGRSSRVPMLVAIAPADADRAAPVVGHRRSTEPRGGSTSGRSRCNRRSSRSSRSSRSPPRSSRRSGASSTTSGTC